MRVLVIKTSSLGDVIHTLPALTDAKKAFPEIVFDWVVEEGFAEIPAWHPAVDTVIPVAIRRWRKNPIKTLSSIEWKEFRRAIKKHHYDYIIDAQGLLKSAWLTRLAKGPSYGYDKDSARESFASWFYLSKQAVPVDLHAVERIRQLFAQSLGYPKPQETGGYQLDVERFHVMADQKPYVVFLHGTTRDNKHWPDTYWKKLAAKVTEAGFNIRLPWGNEVEKQRAESIAKLHENIEVLPRLNLHGVAEVLAKASAAVAVDTGLGHLCAALDVPTISLYGPTSPTLVGAYGKNQIHLSAKDYPTKSEDADIESTDISALTPKIVWGELTPLLG